MAEEDGTAPDGRRADDHDRGEDAEMFRDAPALLDALAAADLLCISPQTLRELVRRDRLRCVEFVATGFRRPIRRYRLKDLIAFIDESVR